jgi:hypothetical protein
MSGAVFCKKNAAPFLFVPDATTPPFYLGGVRVFVLGGAA